MSYIVRNKELNIAAAEMRFQELQKIFFDRVGIIHGKLTQEQKDQVMLSFKRDEFALLVATTVIEVGIDIPDATIMIIENAEQFGLSQLHQLRGSGDILGIKQSGYVKFKFADLSKDKELLNLAYSNAKNTMAEDESFKLLLDIFKYRSRLHFSKF